MNFRLLAMNRAGDTETGFPLGALTVHLLDRLQESTGRVLAKLLTSQKLRGRLLLLT
jgi:hypothetical protein